MAKDRPRLLARQAGKRHPQHYTTSTAAALSREPEAIDEETQRRISLEARTRFAETRREELARKDSKRWCERLRKAEMRARSKGVDVYRFQVEVRRAIVAMEELTE